jgi:hypothetical protein
MSSVGLRQVEFEQERAFFVPNPGKFPLGLAFERGAKPQRQVVVAGSF